MKLFYKMLLIIYIIVIVFLQCNVFASMADYTDEQADQQLKQMKEKMEKEQEEKINKSSNNYLKSLSIKDYNIKPNFDKQTINYELTKEVTEKYIKIEAEVDDQRASTSGNGEVELKSGENEIPIDVKAENGATRTYYIKINRVSDEEIEAKDNDKNKIISNTEEKTNQRIKEEKSKNNYTLLIIVVVLAIIVVFSVIILKNIKKDR